MSVVTAVHPGEARICATTAAVAPDHPRARFRLLSNPSAAPAAGLDSPTRKTAPRPACSATAAAASRRAPQRTSQAAVTTEPGT